MSRRPFTSLYLLLGWLALWPLDLYAWGANGHRIVAEIGQRHLKPETLQSIQVLVGNRPLALLATWPDEIKADAKWDFAKPWHYVNIEEGETYASSTPDPKGDVVQAIKRLTKILEGDKKARRAFAAQMAEHDVQPYLGSVEATALAFLIHFVGDVHQPLHAGYPSDRGGNTIQVEWFGQTARLHAVWDTDIVESEQLSFSEFADFLDIATAKKVRAWQADPVLTWVQESRDVLPRIYDFGDQNDAEGSLPKLSWGYQAENIPLVRERLLQGGVRLAVLLNRIFE